MPRKKLGGAKEESFDSGDANKPSEAKNSEEEKEKSSLPLTRGGKKATRFKKPDSDDEDEKEKEGLEDVKSHAAARVARKAELEKLKDKRMEELKAAEQETAEEGFGAGEIMEEGGPVEAEVKMPPRSESQGALSRKHHKVTRFHKEETLEEIVDDLVSIFEKDKGRVPWIPQRKMIEAEKTVYFRLGKRQSVLKTARDNMRKQGLYVARERLLLPANVERELQRARIMRDALADKAKRLNIVSSEKPVSAVFVDPKTGVQFSADDEKFLVPFEPLKERICRPSMRYDPSLPYLQYDTIVPVTNLDAVFGKAESMALLDLEIKRVTLTDHRLFIEENYLAAELDCLNRKYQRRAEVDWVDFYSQKLDALTSALETLQKERDIAKDEFGGGRRGSRERPKMSTDELLREGGVYDQLMQEQQLQDEIRQVRLQRAQEEYEDLALVSRIISVWEQLKVVRNTQGFNSTKVELKFKKKRMNQHKDEEARQQELEAELAELKRKHNQDHIQKTIQYQTERMKLVESIDKLKDKIAVLAEKETQANLGVPVEEDEEDTDSSADEEDDEDFMLGAPQSPDKKGKKRVTRQADARLATQLLEERMAEEELLEKTQELLKALELKEPRKSDNPFDEEGAVEMIKERHARTKREPGAPIYIPLFSENKARTETGSLPATPEGKKEARRRKDIKALQLYFTIFVNDMKRPLQKESGGTLEVALVPIAGYDFSFTVKETVQLAPTSGIPEIMLQLHEKGYFGASEVANINVPVDDEGMEDRGDPLLFQGTEPFKSESVKAVANKERPEAVKGFKPLQSHWYSGNIFVRVNYTSALKDDSRSGVVREAATLLPGIELKKRPPAMGGGIVSAAKLKKMIKYNQLDPNDPRNHHLLELLSLSKEQENEKHVRFDTLLESARIGELIRVSTKDLVVLSSRWVGEQLLTCPATMRHKLLMAREKSPALFVGMHWVERLIPLLEKDITEDETDFFDKVYAVEFPEVDEEAAKSADSKKAKKVLAFRQKVQQQVRKAKAKSGSRQKKKYKLEDVVHQPALPQFGTIAIIEAIKYALRKRSNLRPEEKPAKVVLAAPDECNIRITVQRAHNLPVRRPEAGAHKPQGDLADDEKYILESVVQARFQNHDQDKGKDTTPVFKGPNPAWNAPLKLRFEPWNNNWSPGNLMKVTDTLHLNVFDTKLWEKAESGGQKRKLEKRWLGSIQFPFHTLYTTGRIDGVFELDCPPHHIGYTRPDLKGSTGKKEQRPTTIQLCIALDPPLQQPSTVVQGESERFKMFGQPMLEKRLRDWAAQCSAPSHCKGRKFQPIGRTLLKDHVLATRFVIPQAPPPDAYNQGEGFTVQKQMMQLCRFVSLIPFLEDFHLEDSGMEDVDQESLDVWCTSSEFIDIMAGDWEEHATLLCNFFLHLKQSAYLVFGSGIPEGDTVYVMTQEPPTNPGEPGEITFWNASKGKRYSSKDIHCTLKEVWYVVNQSNVWGNVQSTKSIPNTSFNLDDPKCWKPLFTPQFPIDTPGVQHDTVQEPIDWKLSQPREHYAGDVAKRIKSAVRNRIEHWRSIEGKSMVGNEGAARKLTEILKKMELAAHQEIVFTEEDLHSELASYLQPGSASSGYNITGFYINRPWTDLEPILDEIYNADIHHAGPVVVEGVSEADTQFAHTVYVRAFPRKILSVWVCVVCLSRKR